MLLTEANEGLVGPKAPVLEEQPEDAALPTRHITLLASPGHQTGPPPPPAADSDKRRKRIRSKAGLFPSEATHHPSQPTGRLLLTGYHGTDGLASHEPGLP